MTLEEAIKHARDTAENRTDLCDECRAEHKQLAEWLEQLVKLTEENERLRAILDEAEIMVDDLKEKIPIAFDNESKKARADTVREMQERLDKHFCHDPAFLGVEQRLIMDVIDRIAKEMLEGEK